MRDEAGQDEFLEDLGDVGFRNGAFEDARDEEEGHVEQPSAGSRDFEIWTGITGFDSSGQQRHPHRGRDLVEVG